MTLRTLGLAAAALALLAPAPDDPTKKDLEKIQGTWKVESLQAPDGSSPPDAASLRVTFDGDKLIVKHGDNDEKKGTFKLDASPKLHTIDLTPDNKNEQPTLGIYELDGDTLKVAMGKPGGARPTEFAPNKDAGVGVVVFKRDKK
jgi:uncharacterized protein (TIGR03067 family)